MNKWKEIDRKAHNYCVVIGMIIFTVIIVGGISLIGYVFFTKCIAMDSIAFIELSIALCWLAIPAIPIVYFIGKMSKGFSK